MRRAKAATMGLTAVVLMMVFGALAGSASAQTLYLFLFTGPLPALILVLSDNTQKFKVEANSALTIECEHFSGQGSVSNGSLMYGSTGKINGNYTECSAVPLGFPAFVSEAEYEVNAQGSVNILKPIVIEVPGAGCTVTVGQLDTHLLSILFLNLAKDILAHVNIGNIHSHVNSALACGAGSTLPTTGSYTGLLLIWVDGGTIQWDS